jgi:predicted metal-binding protein
VGELEDEFDGEGMMETQQLHKERFAELCAALSQTDTLKLGAGCCTLCRDCTYPQAPCRFPEKRISSMEAYGIVVAEVCKANDLPYYYGKNTIAYTSCVLF